MQKCFAECAILRKYVIKRTGENTYLITVITLNDTFQNTCTAL